MVIYYHPHITYFINGGYMFNTLKTLVLAVSLLLPAGAVAAETGVYVAPKFALNVQHAEGNLSFEGQSLGSESKTGARAGGALAVGYDFAPLFQVPVRAELEYGAYGDVSKTVDMGGGIAFKGTMGFQTLLANVYWDITEWNGFTPYLGAGIGMAFLKTEGEASVMGFSESEKNTDTVFAGQVGLGCSYAFTENISADFGYRFLMMGDGDVEKSGVRLDSEENHAHQFMLGLRVTV